MDWGGGGRGDGGNCIVCVWGSMDGDGAGGGVVWWGGVGGGVVVRMGRGEG